MDNVAPRILPPPPPSQQAVSDPFQETWTARRIGKTGLIAAIISSILTLLATYARFVLNWNWAIFVLIVCSIVLYGIAVVACDSCLIRSGKQPVVGLLSAVALTTTVTIVDHNKIDDVTLRSTLLIVGITYIFALSIIVIRSVLGRNYFRHAPIIIASFYSVAQFRRLVVYADVENSVGMMIFVGIPVAVLTYFLFYFLFRSIMKSSMKSSKIRSKLPEDYPVNANSGEEPVEDLVQ